MIVSGNAISGKLERKDGAFAQTVFWLGTALENYSQNKFILKTQRVKLFPILFVYSLKLISLKSQKVFF
jgi:hypothetical protein